MNEIIKLKTKIKTEKKRNNMAGALCMQVQRAWRTKHAHKFSAARKQAIAAHFY